MLQQTQTSRVRVKYEEFIARFPDWNALSRAPLPSVLKVWKGLGYNRRALALQRTARIVAKDLGGELSDDTDALLALPGIGKGTAGAILAFAFNKPVTFIETNIRRVFIHEFFPFHSHVSDEQLMPLIEAARSRRASREWYYALMDYGVRLSKLPENANRRSKTYRRQSKFPGSNRELRSRILELVLAKERRLSALPGLIRTDRTRTLSLAKALEQEGFITRRGGMVRISR
jgi:A/G-specific adenine glycosylase